MEASRLEIVCAFGLILVLVVVALYFGWRQWQVLRRPPADAVSAEDRAHYRSQAARRLIGSVVMLLMAGLLAGTYFFGQEDRARATIDRSVHAPGTEPPGAELDEEAIRRFNARYSVFWISFIVLLLGLVILAFFDLRAIRRFGVRQFRQLQADRRDMLEHEVARLKSERNGH